MSTERQYCGKHVFASGGTYRCVRPQGHEHGCAPTGTTEEWQMPDHTNRSTNDGR